MADVGRPSKYKPEFVDQARVMCELGATDEDLCRAFRVRRSTLNLWKVKHPEFSATLRIGKEPADEAVERALYHRAIGYSHPEVDIRVIKDEIVITSTIKHYPPDTKAALAWLYNRRGDRWHPLPQGDPLGDAADRIIEVIRATKPAE